MSRIVHYGLLDGMIILDNVVMLQVRTQENNRNSMIGGYDPSAIQRHLLVVYNRISFVNREDWD